MLPGLFAEFLPNLDFMRHFLTIAGIEALSRGGQLVAEFRAEGPFCLSLIRENCGIELRLSGWLKW